MSTPRPSLAGDGSADDAAGGGHRRRLLVILVIVVAVVAGLVLWTDHEANRYYVYEPGTAPELTTSSSCRARSSGDLELPDGTPCARIDLPAGRGHALDGSLMMVDVLVGKATPADWVLDELGLLDHFHRASQLYPNVAVQGTTPASQLACQDAQEMAGATTTAPFVALQRLGYKVSIDYLGGQVTEVVPGLAAARAGIECNDLITSIAGHPIHTVDDVERAIATRAPGDRIDVTVRRTGTDGTTRTVVLHATLTGRPAVDGLTADPKAPFLGIMTQTDFRFVLPFDVGIDVGDIGGPSAGLALTLAVLDSLSSGKLTGGHKVAATGTIAPGGAVGAIGGVAQKTVAVERAGAQLFLVPAANYAAAESEGNGKLKIEKVTSLGQALAALKAIGGQVPAPSGST